MMYRGEGVRSYDGGRVSTQPLNYATPAGPDPGRPRHPPAVTWLILLCVVAGFVCGAVGLLFIDVLGGSAGGLMIAGTGALLVAVFGFLSRPRPGFGVAAVIVGLALSAAAVAFVMNQRTAQRVVREILATAAPTPGGVVIVDSRSERGKQLGSVYFARTVSGAAGGLDFCLLVYLVVRTFSGGRRATDLPDSN
jgi:hypothetical protein